MVASHNVKTFWENLTDKMKHKHVHIGLIVVLIILYFAIPSYFSCTGSKEMCSHSRSITNMNLTFFRSFIVTFIALQVMVICDMNIGPTLASIGVAMAALGYIFVDQLKDVITGMLLLYSNNINLGDMVQLQVGYASTLSAPMQITDFYTTTLVCREENNMFRYIPYRRIVQYRKVTQ